MRRRARFSDAPAEDFMAPASPAVHRENASASSANVIRARSVVLFAAVGGVGAVVTACGTRRVETAEQHEEAQQNEGSVVSKKSTSGHGVDFLSLRNELLDCSITRRSISFPVLLYHLRELREGITDDLQCISR
jgi:hypothetical protein